MATQGQTSNVVTGPSPAAHAALLRLEQVRKYYYDNDGAGSCTWGVGFYAHHGPCTPAERQRVVTAAQINVTLATKISDVASAIRRAVPNYQHLTQAQFDALVTYTYNRGVTGAYPALRAANRGNYAAVVSIMNQNVHVHRNGHRVISSDLMRRRQEESAPFRPQQPPQR